MRINIGQLCELAVLRVAYDFVRNIWKVTTFEPPSHNHDLTLAHFVHGIYIEMAVYI
jgi:hypothetical protein